MLEDKSGVIATTDAAALGHGGRLALGNEAEAPSTLLTVLPALFLAWRALLLPYSRTPLSDLRR